jgi:hypothetical protein
LSSLNVSGFSILNNTTTFLSSLNISGFTTLNNNATIISSLNVSGFSTLNNNTTLLSSLNVSGYSTLSNNTTLISSLNVSGFTTLNNNTSIFGALNVSGFTTLNNNTSIFGTLNISGNSTLNNITTLISSLNVSGRTIFGNDIYNYSDSVLEAYKNFSIRKNITSGSRIDLKVGLGYEASYISIEEGYDINISTPNNALSQSIIALSSNKHINLAAPTTYTKNINVDGSITTNSLTVNGIVSGTNIGVKSPIFFTTNRNMTINGISFSVYDIDLRKYTKSILLDGYNIRQFRLRTWLADGDVQDLAVHIIRADIFMTNKGGLNLFALCAPYPNDNLNSTDIYLDQFLYRDTFNNIIYCSRYGSKKVYCIFEDLL